MGRAPDPFRRPPIFAEVQGVAAGAGLGGGGRFPAVELQLPGVRRRPLRGRPRADPVVGGGQRRSPAVQKILCDGSGGLRTLERYCPVEWRAVVPGIDVPLADGLSYRAFDVPTTKRDRFGTGTGHGRVVGYRLTDERTGGTLVYLPGVQALTPTVRAEVAGCDCLLIDGTCWRDDELGPEAKTSREMGHLPLHGPDGSLAQLPALGVRRTIFVHMNNTNPILLADSPERRAVEDRGMEVAVDGLEVEV